MKNEMRSYAHCKGKVCYLNTSLLVATVLKVLMMEWACERIINVSLGNILVTASIERSVKFSRNTEKNIAYDESQYYYCGSLTHQLNIHFPSEFVKSLAPQC